MTDDELKLRVGVEGAYPPFSSVGPDGQIKGFDIDIAKALCEQIKAQCALRTRAPQICDRDGYLSTLRALDESYLSDAPAAVAPRPEAKPAGTPSS